MHIENVTIRGFKRFSHLTIADLPRTARLVVMAGPNGVGKSSVFDAFKMRHFHRAFQNYGDQDASYYFKDGFPDSSWGSHVNLAFHETHPLGADDFKKAFYIRSSYRHEPDFTLRNLQRVPSPLDQSPVRKLIDPDRRVSANYQDLVSKTLSGVYSGEFDGQSVEALREHLIGQLRDSMRRVFGDLLLHTPGDPLTEGTFYFEKDMSKNFHYKNLSGGEKAVFDLLLDLVVKRQTFDRTVYCIDEPELHINTRIQGALLEELMLLIPDGCQLWLATHSIGMMRKARELLAANADYVVFIDFEGHDYDEPVYLAPAKVNRDFWARTLNVALDDLAHLVAPRKVVLCEGRPGSQGGSNKAEFDASCYRTIFGEHYPDIDFISVGSESEVVADRVGIAHTIQTLVRGTTVVKVVDRDDRSDREVSELEQDGVRVLSRRHLEAYLMDDEVIARLCQAIGRDDKLSDVLEAKRQAIQREVLDRGRPEDDVKSAAGAFYVETKRLLGLTQHGNSAASFLRDTLAPLVRPGMAVYAQLKRDVLPDE